MSTPKAILTDTTLCVGCEKCVAACKVVNELGPDVPRRWKMRIDDLSSTRYTTIERRPGEHFVRKFCRHCVDPACVSACLVGALQKTEEGPVIYDSDRCMGCRYCMNACPYGIPRYDWEEAVPLVRKCTMCYERITRGELPGCVEACPYEATIFGDREELLEVARQRLDASPEKYVNQIYGKTEVGGTSVLYISDIPLDFLAYQPDLGETPLPDRTWAALSKVPPLVVGMASLMAGMYWITNRRNKLAEEAAAASAPPGGTGPAGSAEQAESTDQAEKNGGEQS